MLVYDVSYTIAILSLIQIEIFVMKNSISLHNVSEHLRKIIYFPGIYGT
jgi:hypothetical protein